MTTLPSPGLVRSPTYNTKDAADLAFIVCAYSFAIFISATAIAASTYLLKWAIG